MHLMHHQSIALFVDDYCTWKSSRMSLLQLQFVAKPQPRLPQNRASGLACDLGQHWSFQVIMRFVGAGY